MNNIKLISIFFS